MKKNNFFPIFIGLFLLTVLFSNCGGMRIGASSSRATAYETFFVGDEGLQYFIKPLLFKSENNKDKLSVDFTFKQKQEFDNNALVRVNFSIFSKEKIKDINLIEVITSNETIKIFNPELMFIENSKKQIHSRFTMEITAAQLANIFKDNNCKWQISQEKGKSSFLPTKKTSKSIKKINKSIFDLFS